MFAGPKCLFTVRSHIGWKYFLVFKILLQGNAASHDGCELDVVHSVCTGVFGQVFFDDFAANPPNPSDKASDSCGVEERVVRVRVVRVLF